MNYLIAHKNLILGVLSTPIFGYLVILAYMSLFDGEGDVAVLAITVIVGLVYYIPFKLALNGNILSYYITLIMSLIFIGWYAIMYIALSTGFTS